MRRNCFLVLDPVGGLVGERVPVPQAPDDRGELLGGAEIAQVAEPAGDLPGGEAGGGEQLPGLQAGPEGRASIRATRTRSP